VTSIADIFADLPGFYYDPDKNRYFPVKGPIPGSRKSAPQTPPSQPIQVSCPQFNVARVYEFTLFRFELLRKISTPKKKTSRMARDPFV